MQFEVQQKTTQEFIANHVILAIPQYPLKKLAACFPQHIDQLLNSVIPVPILWVAATLKNPPWNEGAKPTSGENAPIRAAHLEYKKYNNDPCGMAMLYCDWPWREYWRSLLEDTEQDYEGYQYLPQINQNSFLKEEIEKTIQQMFNLGTRPAIDEWGIRDWGRPPFGAGVYFWRVGAESKSVVQQLKSFALKDNTMYKNIHICGEAYSEVQGYFEGAIRTANEVISTI